MFIPISAINQSRFLNPNNQTFNFLLLIIAISMVNQLQAKTTFTMDPSLIISLITNNLDILQNFNHFNSFNNINRLNNNFLFVDKLILGFDFVTLFVVYISKKYSLYKMLFFSSLCAYLCEMQSSVPAGSYLFIYTFISICLYLIKNKIIWHNSSFIINFSCVLLVSIYINFIYIANLNSQISYFISQKLIINWIIYIIINIFMIIFLNQIKDYIKIQISKINNLIFLKTKKYLQ